MEALLLPNGNLLVPEVEDFDEGFGITSREVFPDDPVYKEWMTYYANNGIKPPKQLPNKILPDVEEGDEPDANVEEKSATAGRMGSPKPKKIKPSPFLDRDGMIR